MVFADSGYLFLLLLLIPLIVGYVLSRKKADASLQISDASVYADAPKSSTNH